MEKGDLWKRGLLVPDPGCPTHIDSGVAQSTGSVKSVGPREGC